jgi:hypothetical protein
MKLTAAEPTVKANSCSVSEQVHHLQGNGVCVMEERFSTGTRQEFDIKSRNMRFVDGNVALEQVFSVHFSFHCQFPFHRLPHTRH